MRNGRKRKMLAGALVPMMCLSLLSGCGKEESASGSSAAAANSDDGKVFNIYCWDTDFESKMTDYYPDYKDNGDGTGSIGDVKVNWVVRPLDGNEYQNTLDENLLLNMDASADEKIDLFLMEADYILKYVDSAYTLDVEAELGLSEDDLADMYDYTKEIATASDGTLRAVSWQATPGLFAYRRSIARDVLGTDDPDKVQKALSDWDGFDEVAAKAKEKGYKMISGPSDTYRVFANNAERPWVDDATEQTPDIQIDDKLLEWVEQSKKYADNGWTNDTDQWTDEWYHDQSPEGKVFGFFYSTWGINFTLVGNAGEAGAGDWAVCEGPAAWYWGGTWLAGARGTDNKSLVASIMKTMCCDRENMLALTEGTQDYTNNIPAMEELAASDYRSDFLGGQNHIKLFVEAAPKISMDNITTYDAGLNDNFQKEFKAYFRGEQDKQTALAKFYEDAVRTFPELTYHEISVE